MYSKINPYEQLPTCWRTHQGKGRDYISPRVLTQWGQVAWYQLFFERDLSYCLPVWIDLALLKEWDLGELLPCVLRLRKFKKMAPGEFQRYYELLGDECVWLLKRCAVAPWIDAIARDNWRLL